MSSLTAIAPGVFGAEHDHFMPGGIHFRTRMTVLDVGDGLMLHSPIPITEQLQAEIAELGLPVTAIVAPSLLHHCYLAAAARHYGNARVFVPDGLEEKLSPALDGLDCHPLEELGKGAVLAQRIDGVPWMTETVFFHKPSKTLLITDLIFNIHDTANLRTRLLLWLVGAWGRPAQSRMVKVQCKDREALRQSCQAVLRIPFARIVPCHGGVIEEAPHEVLRNALRWVLGAPSLAAEARPA